MKSRAELQVVGGWVQFRRESSQHWIYPDDGSFYTPTKAFAGSARLPRGRKVPPLVSEFTRIAKVILDALPQVHSKRCLLRQLHDIPAGSKFLSHILISGADVDDETRKYQCIFGVYYTKVAFLERAMSVVHPFDSLCPLKDELLKMFFSMVTIGPLWVVEQRQTTLKRWLGYANDLKGQEQALHKSLQTDVGAVLKGKRLLLLEKLAYEVGWADKEIFGLLRSGFSLVGNASPSGIFDVECKPAELTTDELVETRPFMRPALLGKTSSAKLDEDSVELWEKKTCREADGRLLRGPFTVAEVDELFPEGWTPVRRFGVRQSSGEWM